jgi:hypothetical protein
MILKKHEKNSCFQIKIKWLIQKQKRKNWNFKANNDCKMVGKEYNTI